MTVPRPTVPLPWLEPAVLGLALVGFLLVAPGGPGWGVASAHAIGAVQLDRTAAAPLYGALANVAAWVPVGEIGFRLAALDALLAALLLTGVVAATRALVPKLPAAGAIGALLLALAPPLHDASGPGLLAAVGTVWALAATLRATKRRDARDTVLALGGAAIALGGEPWLGVFLLAAIGTWLARAGSPRAVIALAVAGIGAAAIVLWIGALGSVPGFSPSLAATIAGSGRGAGAIVVGAGLLGAAFAAVTGLPGARGVLGIIALAGLHAVLIAGEARGTPLLGVLAIGAALIPVAIVRAAAPAAEGTRALGVCALAGVPLVLVAVVAGPPRGTRDTGDGPARVAHALLDELPAGPGVVLTTRDPSWFALAYAQAIAGERPDLGITPPLPPERADLLAVTAMRLGKVAGGDTPVVGRLDITLARPRGRGFQMLLDTPKAAADVARPPPRYGTDEAAATEARAEAIERARYEASTGRLDQAARALGLAEQLGAADLAVLSSTQPTLARPALFGFVPALGVPPGDWELALFGDDLRWVGGLDAPAMSAADAVAPRRLHALWRLVLDQKIAADDPRITALGANAVAATTAMLKETRPTGAGSGSGSGSGS